MGWSDIISLLGWLKSKKLFSKPNIHIEILDKKAGNYFGGIFYLILDFRVSNSGPVPTKIIDYYIKYNNKIVKSSDRGQTLGEKQIGLNDHIRKIIYFRFDPKEYRTIIETKKSFKIIVKEVSNTKKEYSLEIEPPIPNGRY